ncbi:MAG TPA: arginine--tRNA ligase [Saprospiraceae bacterium]|nr:arginine--tRNA ligase [Saprospiraceae bacterium]
MTDILKEITDVAIEGVKEIYHIDISPDDLLVTPTKKEHKGDFTLVTFSLAKALRQSPPQIAASLGDYIKRSRTWVSDTEVIQGFLNLSLSTDYWSSVLEEMIHDPDYWKPVHNPEKVLVEFSSPNTNKPLHLGHIRNILLGWATYKMFAASGYDVKRVQIVNDRGIAICKSMLAWSKFGNGQTPESAGMKSDHFVGEWYVRFEKEFSKEYLAWQQTDEAQEIFQNRKEQELSSAEFFKNYKNHYFNTYSLMGLEAKEMLLKWEAHDADTLQLWKKMNSWVYAGFEQTYKKLGVEFDKLYYESDTYLLGKDIIEEGVKRNVFYKKDDGSIWVDLTAQGLDHKLLLRKDGTSVYMTQDLGTAEKRYEEFGAERIIYVVGDEQNYHFQALFAMIASYGAPYAKGLYHLSYGMVELPEGKMKSREGTVVDADDLIDVVIKEASDAASEREVLDPDIIRKIGMAALKFFIVKVDPRKRMVFDPKASVDLQGQTGPYIQNAYVRIQSILRKAPDVTTGHASYEPNEDEKLLLNMLSHCRQVIDSAVKEYSPALIANYAYALAKEYHRYYHDVKVLHAESPEAMAFRLKLIRIIGQNILQTMDLLGIEMPERM